MAKKKTAQPKEQTLEQQIVAAEKKLNERQLRFVRGINAGLPAYVAYKRAGYEAEAPDSYRQAASRLLSTNINASSLVDMYRRRDSKAAKMSKGELVDWLIDVVTTPVEEIDESHRLAQEKTVTDTKEGQRVTIKLPSKLGAAQELAKLLGWNQPQQLEITQEIKEQRQRTADEENSMMERLAKVQEETRNKRAANRGNN